MHPAIAFLRRRIPDARVTREDCLTWNLDGIEVEIYLVGARQRNVLFAAGDTGIAYRCSARLSDADKQRLRTALLEVRDALAAGWVSEPRQNLPAGGGWTERVHVEQIRAWRDWTIRNYQETVAADRRDECSGLPDCLDLRMRPPACTASTLARALPAQGPCARCGRVSSCNVAAEVEEGAVRPLVHADSRRAERAALNALCEASEISGERAERIFDSVADACGDRDVDGALPFEFSVRLAAGQSQPDRLRFVSYYPLTGDDELRRRVSRTRRDGLRDLARQWLSENERTVLDRWLEAVSGHQPDTLGLSIGVEMDASGVRLQAYAHPDPSRPAGSFVAEVLNAVGSVEPAVAATPVLVGIALSNGSPPVVKLYHRHRWESRNEIGLPHFDLGGLAAFNPGWGLAVQELSAVRSEFVKWDFPVTAHFQESEKYVASFCRLVGLVAVPRWLSGEVFSPWLTWASIGRGGYALYFCAR